MDGLGGSVDTNVSTEGCSCDRNRTVAGESGVSNETPAGGSGVRNRTPRSRSTGRSVAPRPGGGRMIRVFVHVRRAAMVPVPIILVAAPRCAVHHRGGRCRGGPPDHHGARSRDRLPRGRCRTGSGHGALTIGNRSVDRFQGIRDRHEPRLPGIFRWREGGREISVPGAIPVISDDTVASWDVKRFRLPHPQGCGGHPSRTVLTA